MLIVKRPAGIRLMAVAATLAARLAFGAALVLAAVTISTFNASGEPTSVHLTWKTGSEINNLGFNILRSETQTGGYSKINSQLVPGCLCPGGATYTFDDSNVTVGQTYYYMVQSVDTSGFTNNYGPIPGSAGIPTVTPTPTRTNTPRPTSTPTNPPPPTATPTSTLAPDTATPTNTVPPVTMTPTRTSAAPTRLPTLVPGTGASGTIAATDQTTGPDFTNVDATPTADTTVDETNQTPAADVTEIALNVEATPQGTPPAPDSASEAGRTQTGVAGESDGRLGIGFLVAVIGTILVAGTGITALAIFLIWYTRRS